MCSLCTCPAIPISNRPPVHPAATPPLRGCRRPCTHSTNTARAEAGGIQGGSPPCAGGPGTRRSLAYLSQHLCCYFPLREKVGRGADHGKAMISRSARIGRCRGCQPRINSRVPSIALPCSCGAPASVGAGTMSLQKSLAPALINPAPPPYTWQKKPFLRREPV